MNRYQILLLTIGAVVLALIAISLDVLVTILLLAGLNAVWPHTPPVVTFFAAVFALIYPIPALFWMLEPIRRTIASDTSMR